MGEMILSELGLFNARPTLRVDGQASTRIDRLLRRLEMREAEGGLSALQLSFINWDSREGGGAGHAFEDEATLKLGSELRVYGGEVAAPTELFRGKASALAFVADAEGPPRLDVQAEDGLASARLMRRSQVYEAQSLADIARAIANRAGLTPQVQGLDDAPATWFQCNESDLAFLRRLLARHGADAQVVGAELQVAPRAQVQRNALELRLHSQLQRVRVVADLAEQVSTLRVTGFDPEQGQAVEAEGSGAALGPGFGAAQGRSGRDELLRIYGERREQPAHRLVLSQPEAQALAEAEFAARARRFVRAEGRCAGNPGLRVGTLLTLGDLSPRFDQAYYVTACTHRWDAERGYETDFQAESAWLGQPAAAEV